MQQSLPQALPFSLQQAAQLSLQHFSQALPAARAVLERAATEVPGTEAPATGTARTRSPEPTALPTPWRRPAQTARSAGSGRALPSLCWPRACGCSTCAAARPDAPSRKPSGSCADTGSRGLSSSRWTLSRTALAILVRKRRNPRLSGGFRLAGVPGLEPRITEPETVVLPITPYPKGETGASHRESSLPERRRNTKTGGP